MEDVDERSSVSEGRNVPHDGPFAGAESGGQDPRDESRALGCPGMSEGLSSVEALELCEWISEYSPSVMDACTTLSC
jgi:hypothetical protein